MTVRLAHFSDIHLTARPLGWRPRDLLGKRVSGWVNVRLLGRGRRFKAAPTVIAALIRGLRERTPDAIVFSGDATHLGFESEVTVAASALAVGDELLPPGIAVPGNHDYYTRRAVREAGFERHFAPWQKGMRAEERFVYPFARKVGHVWLIGVCSSTANRWRGDASGEVGPGQLDRLRRLCGRLDDGVRVIVTHYPLRTHDGQIEPRVHRLRDHADALAVAKECGIGLWLHGHIHKGFVLPPTAAIPFGVVCAGSATQGNRWSYCEYTISGSELEGVWRTYSPQADTFLDTEAFGFTLPVA